MCGSLPMAYTPSYSAPAPAATASVNASGVARVEDLRDQRDRERRWVRCREQAHQRDRRDDRQRARQPRDGHQRDGAGAGECCADEQRPATSALGRRERPAREPLERRHEQRRRERDARQLEPRAAGEDPQRDDEPRAGERAPRAAAHALHGRRGEDRVAPGHPGGDDERDRERRGRIAPRGRRRRSAVRRQTATSASQGARPTTQIPIASAAPSGKIISCVPSAEASASIGTTTISGSAHAAPAHHVRRSMPPGSAIVSTALPASTRAQRRPTSRRRASPRARPPAESGEDPAHAFRWPGRALCQGRPLPSVARRRRRRRPRSRRRGSCSRDARARRRSCTPGTRRAHTPST